MIDLVFYENFLHKILTSYWSVKVFSRESFPLYGMCRYKKLNYAKSLNKLLSTASQQGMNLRIINTSTPVETPKKKVMQQSLLVHNHQKHLQRVVRWVVLHENEVHTQLFPWVLLHHVGSGNPYASAPAVVLPYWKMKKKNKHSHITPTWHLCLNSGSSCKLSSESL